MKRKRTWKPIEVAAVLHYWEEPWDISVEGVAKESLRPPLEVVFIRELGARAWRLMGKHWLANKRAFVEMDKLPPDGTAAMARFSASSGVTNVSAARLWQSMQSITRRSPWGMLPPAVAMANSVTEPSPLRFCTQGIVVRVESVATYSMCPRCTP